MSNAMCVIYIEIKKIMFLRMHVVYCMYNQRISQYEYQKKRHDLTSLTIYLKLSVAFALMLKK